MLSLVEAKKEMKRRMLRRMPEAGSFTTSMENVRIHRRDEVEKPRNCLYKPMIVYMMQGRKRMTLGSEEYVYSDDELMVVGIDLPNTSNIIAASPKQPCMAINIDLDLNLVGQLALEMRQALVSDMDTYSPVMLQPIDAELLDAMLRLDTVLDRPNEIGILGKMLVKEIHFRLLLGPNGGTLLSLYSYGAQKSHVAQAVNWLRDNFNKAFLVEDLAERVHMSPSTFHRHFREITSLSPLQFQKRLRLHEAQRLLVSKDMAIPDVCESIGYDNLAQFTREYKRLFGEPPRRDVTRLKQTNMTSLSLAE